MEIIVETDSGQFVTIGILFFVLNLCLSGGIYSWWKSAVATLAFLLFAFIVISLTCLPRNGALHGLAVPFSFRTLTEQDMSTCWHEALAGCIHVLFLTMPIYEVPL